MVRFVLGALLVFAFVLPAFGVDESGDFVRVSEDGSHFVRGTPPERVIIWGVNYDHDGQGRLLDEYWDEEWETVQEDFREIRELGANCVRIHLEVGTIMAAPDRADEASLERLSDLLALAEEEGLLLDVTGLACYHPANIPPWYDALSEEERWKVQEQFWEAVARTCRKSPAVFCYDLMNEPIVPGKEPETDWLAGELGGKFFVQRIALDRKGREPKEIAKAWVDRMVAAIRREDPDHLVTVGVIPWVFAFGGGKPLFHSPEVGENLDFVAVHFYPKKDEVEQALEALKAYEVGKPLVIEEMFPLKCSVEEMVRFIEGSRSHVDGWISFYWGTPAEELRSRPDAGIGEAIIASWLERFEALSEEIFAGPPAP